MVIILKQNADKNKIRQLEERLLQQNIKVRPTEGDKQTILGPAWIIINPLLSSVMYTIIFGRIAGLGTDGVPKLLFYLGSTAFWGVVPIRYRI